MASGWRDYEEQIATAAEAVRVHSATRFSWLASRSPSLPRYIQAAMSERTAREYLEGAIADRLYGDFYASGGIRPKRSEGWTEFRDHAFVGALSAANSGTGPWDPGWRVTRLNVAHVSVMKGGLTLLVPSIACRSTGRAARLGVGADVMIRYPKDLLGMSPGYYLALGNGSWPDRDGQDVVRLYWHLVPDGAVPFVRNLTDELNRHSVLFGLKVLDHPSRYQRCDAGVLYLSRRSFERALPILRSTYSTLAPHLEEGVPALTKPIAPGVGLAEDPPDGQSFGQHRCGLLARGILLAHEENLRSIEDRVGIVLRVFRDAGLDPSRPYLNPESSFEVKPLFAVDR
jgi:hypothetical protein